MQASKRYKPYHTTAAASRDVAAVLLNVCLNFSGTIPNCQRHSVGVAYRFHSLKGANNQKGHRYSFSRKREMSSRYFCQYKISRNK